MTCHECSRSGVDRPAVGLCRFCMVGLCKQHLREVYNNPPAVPQYACKHEPAASFPDLT